jgi:hypothetical protein
LGSGGISPRILDLGTRGNFSNYISNFIRHTGGQTCIVTGNRIRCKDHYYFTVQLAFKSHYSYLGVPEEKLAVATEHKMWSALLYSAMYDTDILLTVKLCDFSVFLCADYENDTEIFHQ